MPNSRIRDFIIGEAEGNVEEAFKTVQKYFDPSLDKEKKLIVSKFLATPDLLLIHGPPGTGKTTLIVELIRQQLSGESNSKVLLVSQTHVAIDHVLGRLDAGDPDLLPVRIGSGSKGYGENVAHCSVEERGRQLQTAVESATEKYLREKAQELGIDFEEVRLGLRAYEVLGLRQRVVELKATLKDISAEKEQLEAVIGHNKDTTTQDESEWRSKARVLQQDLDIKESELEGVRKQLKVADDKLETLGTQGKELVATDTQGLADWCDLLLGEDEQHVRELLEIAEEWRLKFGQSDDFHVAIIAMAKVVAGTCVGFCREAAAMSTQFDLCIVDEASKATSTELLVPIANARKVVLVGDHHQLPAVIEHALTQTDIQKDYSLSEKHLEQQLFERLQIDIGAANKSELTNQYRMREDIGNLVSTCFYSGNLTTAAEVKERAVPDLSLARIKRAVTWIDTDPEKRWNASEVRQGTSFVNVAEVTCIVNLLKRIEFIARNSASIPADYSIGVISGYGEQVEALNREIRKQSSVDILNIDCDTVHAFQGREVDLCIYSITRNNRERDIGFLRDWRHLNVALSRAKDYLIVVGGFEFCRQTMGENPFVGLAEYVENDHRSEIVEWANE